MKYSLTVLICISYSVLFYGQDNLKMKGARTKTIVLGANVTYIPDVETINGIDQHDGYGYKEITSAFNIGLDINKYYRVGLDLKNISTRGRISGRNHYYMVGLFNQYKFYNDRNMFLFVEMGLYRGNYCTCGEDIPYKARRLSYINYGAGLNLKLLKNIRADFAFTNANILTKQRGKYNFTQYIIGLDYLFSFHKKN